MRRVFIGSMIFCFVVITNVSALEQERSKDDQIKNNVLAVTQSELKKKTIQSGTLDVFDKEHDCVRNLRVMKAYDNITKKNGNYLVLIDYRDINTGDIVRMEAEVSREGEDFFVQDIRIKDVRKLATEKPRENKEYSNEEIQAFMKGYLEKQTRFTDGKVMLFDKDSEKMRNLKLIKLKKEVRRLGIFYSSRAEFTDVDAQEIVGVDISVENKKGKLNVRALRIRDVQKKRP